jgi:hypothetical protein
MKARFVAAIAAFIAVAPFSGLSLPVASAGPCDAPPQDSELVQGCQECFALHPTGQDAYGHKMCAALNNLQVAAPTAAPPPAAPAPPQPVYIPPANIPASCQQYVGPDPNGNDQNGVLQLCIATHQLTGN